MKIESLTLREIHMPLVHFFETSFGRTYNRRVMLVTVHCQGLDGWAECVAGEDPFYSEETVETAWWVITNYLAPAIIGRAFTAGRECGWSNGCSHTPWTRSPLLRDNGTEAERRRREGASTRSALSGSISGLATKSGGTIPS